MSAVGEDQMNMGVRNTSSRIQSSLVIRMAMRISRARWFVFLKMIFHYQNGSRTDVASNPFNSVIWMLMEFLGLFIQITIITYVLYVSMDEKPLWPINIWIYVYDLGCVLNLVVLHWRYRLLHRIQGDDFSHSDINQRMNDHCRTTRLMNKLRTCLELFFAMWFVMGNIWVFDSRFGSFRHAPILHLLCIFLLTWNAISYSVPFILFLLLCCFVPLISNLLGYNMTIGSINRGASDEQLSYLPKWNYKDLDTDLEAGILLHIKEDPECCICLAKYREKEEMRQLPCLHIFHLECVDQWLKILSSCPLCKQELRV